MQIAVVGGGVAGMATGVALIATSRARGRPIDLTIYEGHRSDAAAVPALLTPECRSRLAALGCRVSPHWRGIELRGVEVISGGRSELIPGPSGSIWVVDGWPNGESGQRIVSTALAEVAAQHGARVLSRRVDHVSREPVPTVAVGRPTNAELVVRARGVGERYHGVVLATGTSGALASDFLEGHEPPPTLRAVQARLRYPGRPHDAATLRLILNPLPGIDGLYLVPCPTSVFAFAFGRDVEPADFCQAVMAAARDGFLEEGFEIAELQSTQVPCGIGKKLTGRGQVVVGPAALGHPFQVGVSDTLAGGSRAAHALIEAASEPHALRRRYVADGLVDLIEDTRASSRSLKWLRLAGPKAAEAFVRARRRSAAVAPFSGGVLGLPSPAPLALVGSARWAGFRQLLSSTVASSIEPLPATIPELERDLYYVVDDDEDARVALTELLEASGAKVVAFADELALYCAVARRPPTAILLDVVLNWVDGLSLCEGLKQHPLTRGTEVVVMSGLNRPHVRRRALDAGAKAFLTKPIEPDELFAVLGRASLTLRHELDAAQEAAAGYGTSA